MRIAVTSQNFRTITGHAGKTRRFLVYDLQPDGAATEVERLDLDTDQSLHAYHGEDHPLFGLGLDALVTGSAGQGFLQRLARHDVQVLITGEPEIDKVLSLIAAGQPLPPAPAHHH